MTDEKPAPDSSTGIAPSSSPSRKSIVGVLLAVAAIFLIVVAFFYIQVLPRFREMNYNGRTPGNNKAYLSSLKSAINIYYADTQGEYPKALDAAPFLGKYIDAIPPLDLSLYGVERSNKVESYAIPKDWYEHPEKLKNTGHWAYDPAQGLLIIDSKVVDSYGVTLCDYGYE